MDVLTVYLYLSYALITVLIAYVAQRNKDKELALLSYFICVLFWGLRKDIGFDYDGYVTIFKDIQFANHSYVELGYFYLNKLFSPFKDGYIGVLFLSTAITFGFLFYALWRYKILWQGLLFSLVFQFQFMAANQVRQAMAIAFFFCFVHLLRNRRFIKFAICVIITTICIHTSSIVLILCIPLSLIKINKYFACSTVVVVYLLYLKGFWTPFGHLLFTLLPVPEAYENYLLSNRVFSEEVGFSIVQLINVTLGIYILWNKKDIPNYLYSLYYFGLLAYLIFIEYHLFFRMSFYFVYLNIIAISFVCKSQPKKSQIVIVASILFFVLICSRSTNMHGIIPYQSILF